MKGGICRRMSEKSRRVSTLRSGTSSMERLEWEVFSLSLDLGDIG